MNIFVIGLVGSQSMLIKIIFMVKLFKTFKSKIKGVIINQNKKKNIQFGVLTTLIIHANSFRLRHNLITKFVIEI